MEKYSIFERGMHKVVLILTILSIIVMWVKSKMVLDTYDLNDAIGWGPRSFDVITVLMLHVPLFFGLLAYKLTYYLGRKTNKKISILFSSVLLLTILFSLLSPMIGLLERIAPFIRLIIVILFFINIFISEKIYEVDKRLDDILDYE